MIVKIAGSVVDAGSTTAYSAGDLVGTKLTLSDVWQVAHKEPILTNITVQDLAEQNAALTVLIFDANPSATSFTDNAELDIADADLPKVIAAIPIAATDYVGLKDSSVATVFNVAVCVPNNGDDLYACIVTSGTPTYGAHDLSIAFGFAV